MNELSKLPNLLKLSCAGNRLASSDGNPKTANQLLIAKLGQLVALNRSDVSLTHVRVCVCMCVHAR